MNFLTHENYIANLLFSSNYQLKKIIHLSFSQVLQSIGMVGMAAGLKLAISGPVAVAVGATVAFLAKKGIKVDEKCLQDCFDKCYEENTFPVVGVMESLVQKCKEKCIWECSDIKAHLLKTAAKSGSMEILSSPLLIGIVISTLILCNKWRFCGKSLNLFIMKVKERFCKCITKPHF